MPTSDAPDSDEEHSISWQAYRREVLQKLRDLRESDKRIEERLDVRSSEVASLKVEMAVLKTKVAMTATAISIGVSSLAVIIAEFLHR